MFRQNKQVERRKTISIEKMVHQMHHFFYAYLGTIIPIPFSRVS